MEKEYKKLINQLKDIEVTEQVRKRILVWINMAEKRRLRIRLAIFGTSTIVSFSLSYLAIVYLVGKIQESGFWQYLSLFFSGDGVVYTYWKELTYSLIESLPVVGVIASLAAIGLFIWSSTKIIRTKTLAFNF